MFYIKYKIGQIQQYIQFKDINNYFANYFARQFNLQIIEQRIKDPRISVSRYRGEDNVIKIGLSNYIQLNKENNTYKFNVYCQLGDVLSANIILNCFVTSLIMKYDILYLHGILLNNGDIILGQCGDGKTTLAYRINRNNYNLKCLCDDNMLVDLKNKTVYPIPYLPWEIFSQFCNKAVDFNKPFKIKNIFYLNRGEEQKISFIDKDKWIQKFYNCSILYLFHPWASKEDNITCAKAKMWINPITGLFDEVQNKISNMINKYFSEFNFLCITTNTPYIENKFNLIEDKI